MELTIMNNNSVVTRSILTNKIGAFLVLTADMKHKMHNKIFYEKLNLYTCYIIFEV